MTTESTTTQQSTSNSLSSDPATQAGIADLNDQKSNNNPSNSAITDKQQDVLNKLDLAPATLEALKTLSAIGNNEGIEKLFNCGKLTASLEQIRAKKNMRLFEKLDKIKQDFSGLNHKIAKMEESIYDLRKVTNNLVNSLPPTKADRQQQ